MAINLKLFNLIIKRKKAENLFSVEIHEYEKPSGLINIGPFACDQDLICLSAMADFYLFEKIKRLEENGLKYEIDFTLISNPSQFKDHPFLEFYTVGSYQFCRLKPSQTLV